MDTKGMTYTFTARVWYSEWYFVSLPKEMAHEIRQRFKPHEEGWGRLKVLAKIGTSEWKTAIWFDTKAQTYFLPVKKEVRTKEKIGADTEVAVTLWI